MKRSYVIWKIRSPRFYEFNISMISNLKKKQYAQFNFFLNNSQMSYIIHCVSFRIKEILIFLLSHQILNVGSYKFWDKIIALLFILFKNGVFHLEGEISRLLGSSWRGCN
jgi:hypothetical protein